MPLFQLDWLKINYLPDTMYLIPINAHRVCQQIYSSIYDKTVTQVFYNLWWDSHTGLLPLSSVIHGDQICLCMYAKVFCKNWNSYDDFSIIWHFCVKSVLVTGYKLSQLNGFLTMRVTWKKIQPKLAARIECRTSE